MAVDDFSLLAGLLTIVEATVRSDCEADTSSAADLPAFFCCVIDANVLPNRVDDVLFSASAHFRQNHRCHIHA